MSSPEAPRPQTPRPEPSPAAPQGPTQSPGYQAAARTEAAGVSAPPTDGGSKTGYASPTEPQQINDNRQGPFAPSSHPTADKVRSTLGTAVGFVKEAAHGVADAVKTVYETIEPPPPAPPPTASEVAAAADQDRLQQEQINREIVDRHVLTTSGEPQMGGHLVDHPLPAIAPDSVANPSRIRDRTGAT